MFDVVTLDRVCVTHQHNGCGAVLEPENANHLQNLQHAYAKAQGFVARFLNHGAVSAGVGERHPQFNHIGTASDHAVHQLGGDVGKRKACGDIGNECFTASFFESGKGCLYSAHLTKDTVFDAPLMLWPWQDGRQKKSAFDRSATVPMSLSPRPDRLTRML